MNAEVALRLGPSRAGGLRSLRIRGGRSPLEASMITLRTIEFSPHTSGGRPYITHAIILLI